MTLAIFTEGESHTKHGSFRHETKTHGGVWNYDFLTKELLVYMTVRNVDYFERQPDIEPDEINYWLEELFHRLETKWGHQWKGKVVW